jgi:hypothetical protein
MWFGPPRAFTRASPWPWIDHPVSGLQHATVSPYSDSLSLWLRLLALTSPHTVTRRSVLQKVRHQAIDSPLTACKHTVSGSFSLPSRGAFHLSLTVLCAIGRQVVFSLGRWSSQIPTGFYVPHGTQVSRRLLLPFAYRTFTFCGGPFQTLRLGILMALFGTLQPQPPKAVGLGSSLFARHY